MSQYPHHDATLAWAIREEGVHEDPPGSNNGARIRFYQSHTWLAPPKPGDEGWAWCVAFGDSAIQEGGGFKFPEPTAGAWDALDRAARHGWALNQTEWKTAIPGDGVVFNIGSGHYAILKDFKNVGGQMMVQTVDGNSKDMVRENLRPLTVVRGFVHWPETAAPPPAVAPLKIQVVTGESGRRQLVHARTGVVVQLPRVDVTVDGRLRNTNQRPDNPALLRRIALFAKTAKVVTISRTGR